MGQRKRTRGECGSSVSSGKLEQRHTETHYGIILVLLVGQMAKSQDVNMQGRRMNSNNGWGGRHKPHAQQSHLSESGDDVDDAAGH